MNIDVTVTDGGNTWSEKFQNVAGAREDDGGSLEVVRADPKPMERGPFSDGIEPVALFSRGAWHSWRKV